ncbi:MAG: hypothetical protein FWE42_08620 [Defluviitaleaceae bacterium]|nr:hypothetical protein [Defluviitaleaceae bacterium]
MSIVTPNEYWEDRTRNSPKIPHGSHPAYVQYATVTGLTPDGRPIIMFAGDSIDSNKKHPQLKSYVPAAGDMVQLLNGVIQGGWQPNA